MKKFRHKLKVKLRTATNRFFVKLSLRLNQPRLTAFVLSRIVKKIDRGSQYNILVLARSIFYDDIAAMAKFSGQINYLPIHFMYWQMIFNHLAEAAERHKLTEENYHTTSACREGKQRYYEYLKRVLPSLQARLGFQAILSGNISYIKQQEIFRAARDLSIPTLVLHKEALDVYGGILENYRHYTFPGAKVLFYNQRIRDALVQRVDGLTSNKTAVVGVPRLDYYFQSTWQPKPKQIVFFSIFPRDKFLAFIKDKKVAEEVKQAYAAFHKLIMDFSAQNPEYSVIIKTKSAQHYLDYPLAIYRTAYPKSLPNLTITNFASTSELIQNSAVTIGFDSTVLIEAAIMRRPIVCPDFRHFLSDRSWDFLAGLEGLVRYVKTDQELTRALLGADSPTPEYNKARDAFLTELIGGVEGGASLKAEQAIIETI